MFIKIDRLAQKDGEWHKFYAIWPRKTSRGVYEFLTTIERRWTDYEFYCFFGMLTGYRWEYRGDTQ